MYRPRKAQKARAGSRRKGGRLYGCSKLEIQKATTAREKSRCPPWRAQQAREPREIRGKLLESRQREAATEDSDSRIGKQMILTYLRRGCCRGNQRMVCSGFVHSPTSLLLCFLPILVGPALAHTLQQTKINTFQWRKKRKWKWGISFSSSGSLAVFVKISNNIEILGATSRPHLD